MNTDELVAIFKNGGVVSVDGTAWTVDKAHSEDDMPVELRSPLNDEYEDDWLDRQSKWWDTLEACNCDNTEPIVLIEALCKLAGVRLRYL